MMWSVTIIPDLVYGWVHKSPNRCCWQARERGVATIRKLILWLCSMNRHPECVDNVAWQLFVPVQSIPTVQSARLFTATKYLRVICVEILYHKS